MTDTERAPTKPRSAVCLACCCSLCVVIAILLIVLVLSIAFVGLRIRSGAEPTTLAQALSIVYAHIVAPIFTLTGEMLKSMSPWGVIFIIALCTLLWGPAWIKRAVTSSKWEFGSLKFDPSGGQAAFQNELSEAARIVESTNQEIYKAYLAARAFASMLRDRHDIQAIGAETAKMVANAIGPNCPTDFRLTLYVPDFVFSDRLYQFTEYYNKGGQRITDDRAGRTFSIRYGIIGRVWRSGVAELERGLDFGARQNPTAKSRGCD